MSKPTFFKAVFLILLGYSGLTSFAGPVPSSKPSHFPNWWFERDVIEQIPPAIAFPVWGAGGNYSPINNYALANQGQGKWLALMALNEADEHRHKGASIAAQNVILSLPLGDNYQPLLFGQLKNLAYGFYDSTAITPWDEAIGSNYEVANVGQLLNCFSFSFFGIPEQAGHPIIHEVVSDNGNNSDWIEIYNPTESTIPSLSKYYFSTQNWFVPPTLANPTVSSTIPIKKSSTSSQVVRWSSLFWRLPDIPLPAHGYMVFRCDQTPSVSSDKYSKPKDDHIENGEYFTNFSLSKDGEYLGLFHQPDFASSSISRVQGFSPSLPRVRSGSSVGLNSNFKNLVHYKNKTSGAANASTSYGVTKEPVFSLPSGIYDIPSPTSPLVINVAPQASSDIVMFTLDGSLPELFDSSDQTFSSHFGFQEMPLEVTWNDSTKKIHIKGKLNIDIEIERGVTIRAFSFNTNSDVYSKVVSATYSFTESILTQRRPTETFKIKLKEFVPVTSSSTSSNVVTVSSVPSSLVVGAKLLGKTVDSIQGNTITLSGNANKTITTSSSEEFTFIKPNAAVFPANMMHDLAPFVNQGYPASSWSTALNGVPTLGAIDYEMDPRFTNQSLAIERKNYSNPQAPVTNFNLPVNQAVKKALGLVPLISIIISPEDLFDHDVYNVDGDSDSFFENYGDGQEVKAIRCSFEFINPSNPNENVKSQAFVEPTGDSSALWVVSKKKSLKLSFGDHPDSGIRAKFFADQTSPAYFSSINLKTPTHDSWHVWGGRSGGGFWANHRNFATYIADAFVAKTLREMSFVGVDPNEARVAQPNCRAVHVMLNGLYWGVYYLHERADSAYSAKESSYISPQSSPQNLYAKDFVTKNDVAKPSSIANDYNKKNLVDFLVTYQFCRVGDVSGFSSGWNTRFTGRILNNQNNYHYFASGAEWDTLDGGYNNIQSWFPTLTLPEANSSWYKAISKSRLAAFTSGSGPLTKVKVEERFSSLFDEFYKIAICESMRWGDSCGDKSDRISIYPATSPLLAYGYGDLSGYTGSGNVFKDGIYKVVLDKLNSWPSLNYDKWILEQTADAPNPYPSNLGIQYSPPVWNNSTQNWEGN